MKNLKSITFLIVTFCLIFYSCDTNNNLEPFLSNSKVVDSIVGSYVDNGSQALLLVRVEGSDGNVKYEYSKKNNKLVPDYKINKDTWFRIWSMSKIVTISLTLDLVEDGLLKLEDPVSKYIPELRDLKIALSNNGQPLTNHGQALGNDKSEIKDPCPIKLVESDSEMTVLQLINHEAGFYYSTTGIECLDNDLASKNLAASKNSNELIQKLSELPLIDHPGNKHFYGLNTTVLGLVNERVSVKDSNGVENLFLVLSEIGFDKTLVIVSCLT
jgi:CubicO group peptidase (beta-lactamase class C family)